MTKFENNFGEDRSKNNIVIYIDLFLAASMTFVYRQLKSVESNFTPIVFSSRLPQNQTLFPYHNLYYSPRSKLHLILIRIEEILLRKFSRLATNPRLTKKQNKFFVQKLTEFKPKLIHAHFGPSGLEILALSLKLKIPLIVTLHGYDASKLLNSSIYRKNLKKLFKYTYIITVSKKMQIDLEQFGLDRHKCSVIHCGIPVSKFTFTNRKPLLEKSNNDEEIIFLQVSSFVEKKGHRYTLLAFKELRNSYQNSKLIFAGFGERYNEIKELCRSLGLCSSVKFIGQINEDEVLNLMKTADVFLHHSVTSHDNDKEGIPTVIMEAMATGLPAISTFHAGIPELIDDGVNGYLVPEKDVNSYIRKMKLILKSNSEINKNARMKIEKEFNLEIEMIKLKKIYSELIKQNI